MRSTAVAFLGGLALAMSPAAALRLRGTPSEEQAVLRSEANAPVADSARLAAAPAAPVSAPSYTMTHSQLDRSIGGQRTGENSAITNTDMYGELMRAHPVQEMFTNGVDMSATLEAKRVAEYLARGDSTDVGHTTAGKVNDGLDLASAFGEDAADVGTHAVPDVPSPVNAWNPVPPLFAPEPQPVGLEASIGAGADGTMGPVARGNVEIANADASPDHEDPDGLSTGGKADSRDVRKANLVYRPKTQPMPGSVKAAPISDVTEPGTTPAGDSTYY
jgi:hypothetical protein|eukprot:TRINITY_DN2726_c0_g1_i4.p2 TRINITY_DN2726_c0_g1~~TRINITY_DN2726_c0_g1_i4.p2  ORF type:complete len:275 (+),score=125.13 TRINITY_DN2726_c0_g1_i4:1026-1850(+)